MPVLRLKLATLHTLSSPSAEGAEIDAGMVTSAAVTKPTWNGREFVPEFTNVR